MDRLTMPPLVRLRRLAWALLGFLVLENLLGTFANLYITLPSGNAILAIFTSIPVLAVHVVVGFLMLGMAATMVIVATRAGARRVRNLAAVEVALLAVAIQERFAFAATQDNAYSFGMEAAFVLAVAVVAGLLSVLGRAPTPMPSEVEPVPV